MYIRMAVSNIKNLMMKGELLSLFKGKSGYVPGGPEINHRKALCFVDRASRYNSGK
jgi:hypothetical protein